MSLFCRRVLAVITGLILLPPSFLPAAEPHLELKPELKLGAKPPVEIKLRPCVGPVQDVDGVVNSVGMPVLFVKSGKSSEPWWVQNYPVATGPRQFKVRLIFGNDTTPSGTVFHVAAVMMPKTTRWQDYQVGSQHANLPELPQSNQLQVTMLGIHKVPGVQELPTTTEPKTTHHPNRDVLAANVDLGSPEDVVSIATPTTDAAVLRVTEITGRIAAGYAPVVLIRPLLNDKLWWIQNRPVVTSDQRFRGKIVLGNEKTPEGTSFRVVILAFEDSLAAEKLKVGGSLNELPAGVKKSPELTVTYRHTRLASGETTPVKSSVDSQSPTKN